MKPYCFFPSFNPSYWMKIIEHCTLLLSHTNTSVQITISSGLGDFVPSGLFPVGSNLPTIFSPDSRQTAGSRLCSRCYTRAWVFIVLRIKARICRGPPPHVRPALTLHCRPHSLPHLLVPACHHTGGPSFPLPGRFTTPHPFCLLRISGYGPFLREALPD